MTSESLKQKSGFSPIADAHSKLLILGSMPGEKSLSDHQYYAHPQNSFWKIIFTICNEEYSHEYSKKIHVAKKNQIAIWDVLQSCQRTGSLDSNIVSSSIKVNDFTYFLATHKDIAKIYFNGQKAHQLFTRHVLKNSHNQRFNELEMTVLPSTSPAHASMNLAEKIDIWQQHIKINPL